MVQSQVKVIGSNGQLSLGKQFAGKMVLVEQTGTGTWLIKAGEFIPDSEKWLHVPGEMEKLDKSLKWAEENPAKDNYDELITKFAKKLGLENELNKDRLKRS